MLFLVSQRINTNTCEDSATCWFNVWSITRCDHQINHEYLLQKFSLHWSLTLKSQNICFTSSVLMSLRERSWPQRYRNRTVEILFFHCGNIFCFKTRACYIQKQPPAHCKKQLQLIPSCLSDSFHMHSRYHDETVLDNNTSFQHRYSWVPYFSQVFWLVKHKCLEQQEWWLDCIEVYNYCAYRMERST